VCKKVSQSGAVTGDATFSDLRYDRVCRTPQSEAYLLSEGDAPFGRIDLHFGTSVVHAVTIWSGLRISRVKTSW
jgi:hypothetical protein